MNQNVQSECKCVACPGAGCDCGCQQPAASKTVCACGPQCKCGDTCACAKA